MKKLNVTAISTDEIIDMITGGIDVKGIANMEDWPNSKPVTLHEVLRNAMKAAGNITWLEVEEIPMQDEELHITKNIIRADELATGSISAEILKEDNLLERIFEEKSEPQDNPVPEQEDTELSPFERLTPEEYARYLQETQPKETKTEPEAEAAPEPEAGEAPEPEVEPEPEPKDVPEGWTEYEPKKPKKDLGKWAEYAQKALSQKEMKEIAYAMLDEGYSCSRIAQVIRASTTTVWNWKNKREKEVEQA